MATAVNKKKGKSHKTVQVSSLPELMDSGKQAPLLWSLPESLIGTPISEAITRQHAAVVKKSKTAKLVQEIRTCISKARPKMIRELDVLSVLSVVHCLPHLSGCIDSVEMDSIIDWCFELVNGAGFELEVSPDLFQLAKVELPLSLVYGLPDADTPAGLADESALRMAQCVSTILDSDGWPEARWMEKLGLLAASWTRCFLIVKATGIELDSETALQLEWMVRQFLRLLRADDSLMLSEPGSGISCEAFRRALMTMSTDELDHRAAKIRVSRSRTAKQIQNKLPELGSLSEWAQLGALQCSWLRGSPKLALEYHDRRLNMEIASVASLVSGDCTPEVSINGRPNFIKDEIQLVCHETNKDVDYVELHASLGDVTLQRQILLNRSNRFLFLADVVVPSRPARIDYRCEFPFGDDIQGFTESETREIYLKTETKYQSMVLPLGLPEWKNARTDDSFLPTDRGLQLNQSINGEGLVAALFFVLKPKQSTKPRTWRRLTVAEKLETVGRDVAVAYRVLVGRCQWVFYRSIVKHGNRTFLGENVSSEFFVGEIESAGRVRSLLEIDG